MDRNNATKMFDKAECHPNQLLREAVNYDLHQDRQLTRRYEIKGLKVNFCLTQ